MRKMAREQYSYPTQTVDQFPYEQLAPSIVESDVSSVASLSDLPKFERTVPQRKPLQWDFHGLTIWVELEEVDKDLTKAGYHFASIYGTEVIPKMHLTAIYGMEHLTETEARRRLAQIPMNLPDGKWPIMERPVAVKQDLAEDGKPGQVCTISWAELSMKTNKEHERAMDTLCKLFEVDRKGPWTPHLSLAYDNPDESVLKLSDVIAYTMQNPSLLQEERRVAALSLWSTRGKMGDWKCLDRVKFI